MFFSFNLPYRGRHAIPFLIPSISDAFTWIFISGASLTNSGTILHRRQNYSNPLARTSLQIQQPVPFGSHQNTLAFPFKRESSMVSIRGTLRPRKAGPNHEPTSNNSISERGNQIELAHTHPMKYSEGFIMKIIQHSIFTLRTSNSIHFGSIFQCSPCREQRVFRNKEFAPRCTILLYLQKKACLAGKLL